MDVSFILPARDAAAFLECSIPSIHRACRGTGLAYEIIVVDHRSTDATRATASRLAADVVEGSACRTVAALRNLGAQRASGRVLVFLDADVAVADDWAAEFKPLLERLSGGERLLSGAEVQCPPSDSWILRTWFDVRGKDQYYVNSAHLLLSAADFSRLGGFSPALISGEDYDLAQRARAAGMTILPEPRLVAYHLGYPRSLGAFFTREIWHGTGDRQQLLRGGVSRMGLASALLAAAFLAGLALAVVLANPAWLAAPFLVLVLLALAAAARRPKRRLLHFLPVTLLYVVYLAARAVAMVVPSRMNAGRH